MSINKYRDRSRNECEYYHLQYLAARQLARLSFEERFLADEESLVAVALNLYNSCIPFHICCQRSCKLNKTGAVL